MKIKITVPSSSCGCDYEMTQEMIVTNKEYSFLKKLETVLEYTIIIEEKEENGLWVQYLKLEKLSD